MAHRAATARELLEAIAAHNHALPPADADEHTPGTRRGTPRRPKRYVLVVEDDPDCRDVVVQVLSDCGYRVKSARTGLDAIRIINEEFMRPQATGDLPRLPSVILLDLHMPEMDGMLFFAWLKERPQFAHVPVLAMSDSHSIGEFVRWAINTDGLDAPEGTLPKPLAVELLIEKVAEKAGLPE